MNGPLDREAMMELVAAYALGVLPASERRLVTAYLLEDAQARTEFDALRPAADLIGLSAENPVEANRSARMKQRLLAAINIDAPVSSVPPTEIANRRRAPSSSWFAGAGLAAAAAVVFSVVSTMQNVTLRSDLAHAAARTAALQTQVAQNDRVRTRDRETIADLGASDAQRYAVSVGQVVTHGAHLYLTLNALPPLPRGKVYQAWTIAKGSKTLAPSLTFVPGAGGGAVVALPENPQHLNVVALSVEPQGGSKAPTSKPTFVRPLS